MARDMLEVCFSACVTQVHEAAPHQPASGPMHALMWAVLKCAIRCCQQLVMTVSVQTRTGCQLLGHHGSGGRRRRRHGQRVRPVHRYSYVLPTPLTATVVCQLAALSEQPRCCLCRGSFAMMRRKWQIPACRAVHTTAATIRPGLQVLRSKAIPLVSSVFFMCLPDRVHSILAALTRLQFSEGACQDAPSSRAPFCLRLHPPLMAHPCLKWLQQVLVYGDCAVNVSPSALDLAHIAIASADTWGCVISCFEAATTQQLDQVVRR